MAHLLCGPRACKMLSSFEAVLQDSLAKGETLHLPFCQRSFVAGSNRTRHLKPYFQCAVCMVCMFFFPQRFGQPSLFLVLRVIATITTTDAAEYPFLSSIMSEKWSPRVPRSGGGASWEREHLSQPSPRHIPSGDPRSSSVVHPRITMVENFKVILGPGHIPR